LLFDDFTLTCVYDLDELPSNTNGRSLNSLLLISFSIISIFCSKSSCNYYRLFLVSFSKESSSSSSSLIWYRSPCSRLLNDNYSSDRFSSSLGRELDSELLAASGKLLFYTSANGEGSKSFPTGKVKGDSFKS